MKEDDIKNILAELYALDESLREHEADVIKLIYRMEEIRPDTKFDQEFAARLKSQIMAEAQLGEKQKFTFDKMFNFNFMNKKIYLAAGSLVVVSLLFLAFINFSGMNNRSVGTLSLNKASNGEGITKVAAGAFGSLAGLAGQTGDVMQERSAIAPLGMGAADASATANFSVVSAELAESDIATTDLPVAVGMGGGVASSKMIMPPFYGFNYVYAGDSIELTEESAAVYRRIKGGRDIASSMVRTLNSFGLSDLSIDTFQNLKMANFSVIEDRDMGLIISFDLQEDLVNIYENWNRWGYAERDACGNDQACWDSFRLKINDVPADSAVIALADRFLNDHQVNRSHYGQAQVDNSWRTWYEASEDKASYYIPEQANIVYPLIVDGEEVRDQNGGYYGLRVTVNLLKNSVSSMYGLFPYNFEASDYVLETDSAVIVKTAENGGFNRNYYMSEENLQTIELGTPTRAYVQTWKYDNGKNDELLVPALIFPVINRPTDMVYYYGQNYIVVPLVKEMIAELSKQPEWMPFIDDVVRPMPAIDSGEEGMMEIMPVVEPMLLKQ